MTVKIPVFEIRGLLRVRVLDIAELPSLVKVLAILPNTMTRSNVEKYKTD